MSAPKVDVPNKELIDLVVQKLKGDYTRGEVEDVLFNFVLVLHDLLRQGKSWNFSGLGRFRPIARPPGIRYNPLRRSVGIINPWWQFVFKPDAYAKSALGEAPMPDWVKIEYDRLEKEWQEELKKIQEEGIEDKPLPKPKRKTTTTLENKIRGKYNKSTKPKEE